MIRATVTVEDKDLGMEDLIARMEADDSHVDIGIHADEDQKLIIIAGAHEFGATINHPGGTAYGYATPEDAKRHRIKFLKGGTGHKVLGVTKPHTIIIPARSYIRSTVDENEDKYFETSAKLAGKIIDGDFTKEEALAIMGQLIERDIKRKIVTLRSPPNAPSTIRRKGEDNPLIDQGHLLGSVRFVVKAESQE